MRKIDSSLLVCTATQSQKLMDLGIDSVATFCYERDIAFDLVIASDEGSEVHGSASWIFAGEYVGQDNVLPALTWEELNAMIGGDYVKPDLYTKKDWKIGSTMMQYILHLPSVRKETPNGAQALAELAIYLLETGERTAEEMNAGLNAFATKEFYNPINDQIEREAQQKLKAKQ